MILAGGRGTRLRPVTVDLPKPLVPIANRPIVEHQLRHLADSGVRDVTLALGYAAERFEPVAAEAEELGLNLQLFTEPEPLGTGGALRWCADQGAFDDRPLLWMNGDVVAKPNPQSLLELHQDRDALLTFWLTSVRAVSEFGVLELDADLRVQRFFEKPGPDETDSHLINAGILMLDPQALQRIPTDTFFSFEKELLPILIRDDEPVYGLFDGGYWLDIGRPGHYLSANRHVLEGRVDWQPAGERTEAGLWQGQGVKRDGVDIILPAVLGDDVTIEEGAQLFGRTVLGRNVTVGAGAKLEGCVLFDDVEVGAGSEVVSSIVCAGARIGEDVLLQDTVVGANAVVGDGNKLRRTRLWSDVDLADGVLIVDS